MCTIVAQNIEQNRPDNFSSYSPDNQHCSDDVYMSLMRIGVGFQDANPLNFARVPQTHEPISAVSGPKFAIL